MDAKWVVGGLCAAAGLGLLAYYLSDDGKPSAPVRTGPPLRRDQLIQILIDMKKEATGVFFMIASFATSVQQQTEGKIDPETLREILIAQTPLADQMSHVEAKVYSKHNVCEDQVRKAYEVTFADDPEVFLLGTAMAEGLENAFRGLAPISGQDLPDFLTPNKALQILDEIYRTSEAVARRKLPEIKAKGIEFSPYNQAFVQEMQKMETETEEAKEAIFKRHGLDALEEPASLVFNQAIQTFSSDPGFMTHMSELENGYKTRMQAMMTGIVVHEESKTGQEPMLQYSEGGGMPRQELEFVETKQVNERDLRAEEMLKMRKMFEDMKNEQKSQGKAPSKKKNEEKKRERSAHKGRWRPGRPKVEELPEEFKLTR